MDVLVAVVAAVVALLAVLVAGLLRSHAEILRALHDLGVDLDPDRPEGSRPVPGRVDMPRPRAETRVGADITGSTPNGDAARVAVVGVEHSTLVAFLTSGCTTCVEFWNAFAGDDELRVPGGARLVVVTKGDEAESPARLRRFAPLDVLVVMSSEAWDAYDVPVAPYFAYVDGQSGRVVGEGAAQSWGHLVSMMTQALADAGISTRGRRGRSRAASSRDRERRVDRDLLDAGIEPGHPSLYPSSEADLHDPQPNA